MVADLHTTTFSLCLQYFIVSFGGAFWEGLKPFFEYFFSICFGKARNHFFSTFRDIAIYGPVGGHAEHKLAVSKALF